jgi:rhodanese-related sulfurtransferase/polyisoprenoid-binding protein YceI
MIVLTSPAELTERLKNSPRPILVDVRLEDDYAVAHLPGARNNCVFEVAFLDRMANVAPEKGATVCVYGATADSYEGRMAAEKLQRVGYTDVLELREGMEGWKSAGLPVEGDSTQGALIEATLPPNGWRDIDLAQSRVEWLGRNLLNKHYGEVALKEGRLRFDEGQVAAGEFTLDMRTMTCLDLKGDPLHDVLIAHLMSDDFFDVELFPEARFEIIETERITGATPGAPDLAVRGELTLKNVSLPFEFLATTGFTPEGKAAAQSVFAIDRTQWNVLYGSGKYFRNLGGHLVNDLIEIQLRVVEK